MAARRTLLVIEDEPDLVTLLRAHFEPAGYRFLSAGTVRAGLEAARRGKPDVILLDVQLPDGDGFDLFKLLRRETSAPIFFVSAMANEVDRVLGLKLGADDYIVKPFSMAELIARVDAVLRRVKGARADGNGNGNGGGAARDGLSIDPERFEVRIDGRPVKLAPREFQILKLLFDADGKVLSRDHLMEQVWGGEESLEFSARTIDQHVARLRRKLRSEKRRVVTVHGSGYQLRPRAPPGRPDPV